MNSTWALTFLLAAGAALALTPVLRRLALRMDFVDHPSSRKSHVRTVPYGGGLVLLGGTVLGTLVGPFAGPRAALLLAGAALLALIGLADDRRNLGPWVRLGTEIGLACAAFGFGVQAVATGIAPLDAVITIVWIAGITNAFNLLDNMDGLTGLSGLACGVPIFLLGALGGQFRIATVAVAMAAACVGYLAYNFRPALIFMGDSGALFLGFLVATLTLQVAPDLAPPASFLVPLLIVGVPIIDTTTVTIDRLRHGVSPFQGGKDHLSHRLVARGFSREAAVGILFVAQLTLGLLAAAIGRGALPLPTGIALAVATVFALIVVAVPGRMYRTKRQPVPRRVRLGLGLVALALIAAAVPAVVALIEARGPLNDAAASAMTAVAAARSGDVDTANASFERAEQQFKLTETALGGPLRSLGLAVPGLSSNLRAARQIARTGVDLSAAGIDIAATADPQTVTFVEGKVDLGAIETLTADLDRAVDVLRRSHDEIAAVNYPYLVPQVRIAVDRLEAELASAERDAEAALEAAQIAPALLGRDTAQRYFLAVQNNAEARATGGFIGNFGEIIADNGQLRVERFGRIGDLNPGANDVRTLTAPPDYTARYGRFGIERTWQNVNVSPDLTVVSQVIADLYPQSGGQPIDGVIAVDPVGLAALLQLTGPVVVAPWPEPITAANVVDVTLVQAYVRFPRQEQRVDFLGDVADAVVRAVTSSSPGSPGTIIAALGPAVADGHLRMTTMKESAAPVLDRLGLSGAVPDLDSDGLMVTTQNAAANKLDVYLQRRLTYEVTLAPAADGSSTAVDGQASVELTNDLPDGGLPESVTGPYDDRFTAGENLTFLSLYSPLGLVGGRLDGRVTGLETADELDRRVYSTFIGIPADESRTLAVDLRGDVGLDDGWYEFALMPQPALRPDEVSIRLQVDGPWEITAVENLVQSGPATARADLTISAPTRVRMKLERRTDRSLLSRLLRPEVAPAG